MKSKKNNGKCPQSALAFYIKLYCDRKASKNTVTKYHSKLLEATKSWLSLSEIEKQQFTIKFKEYEKKYKLHIFSQLKNAELFMKIKTGLKGDETRTLENTHDEDQVEELIPDTEQTDQIETNEELNCVSIENNLQSSEFQEHEEENNQNSTIDTSNKVLIIKTGQQLFDMLNSAHQTNDMIWTSLPIFEKRRYSRAVSIMKKDYISKYKEYLESLSSKELFDYYNKTF